MKRRNAGRTDSDGYRIVSAPGHPLAREDGSVREHRMVLFDAIGPGEHPCHWCGWPVSWDVTYRAGGSREERWSALIVDHLDGDRAHNELGNLVPSCPYDNSNRAGMQRKGRQPADFTDTPPWERPLFGNVMAETHSRRKLRRSRVGHTVLPPRPAVPEMEPPSPAEDKAQEALGAALYGGVDRPAAVPGPAAFREFVTWARWAVGVAGFAVWLAHGWLLGLAVTLVWFLWVAPLVVWRRPPPGPAPGSLRSWRSWESALGGTPAGERVELPEEAPEPEPPPDDELDDEEVEPPLPLDFEPVPDDPGPEDDEEPGGVLIPMRRPGLPPPPRRRR